MVRADAQAQAAEIGLDAPRDLELHYLLWLLIGPHYLTDPLFPWTTERFETGDTPSAGLWAVAQYGYRRLNRTISIQGIMARAKV